MFLDLFGCNMAGIYLGALTLKFAGVSRINWIYKIPKANRKWYTEKIIYLPFFQVNDNKKIIPDKVFTRKDLGLPSDY